MGALGAPVQCPRPAKKPLDLIGELANILTSKMEFLGINKKTISNFQLLLLQTERAQEVFLCEGPDWCLPVGVSNRGGQGGGPSGHFKYTESEPRGDQNIWISCDEEIMEVEMDVDDDNEEEPPAPGTEEDSSGRSGPANMKIIESTTPFGKGQKRKAGQGSKTVTIGSSPILYTQAPVTAAPLMSAAAYWGIPAVAAPLVPCEPPAPPVPVLPPQLPLPPPQPAFEPVAIKVLPADKTKKTKKDKSKKSKTRMPSLVKKWQSIQKELDEEEKSSSSDEDRDLLNKKSIEEWKQQQLMTGKASKNANFEALPDDWRDRLKKRKLMNIT
ncbi:hypothetical protein GOODEAATRI_012584 [Goodea atripinnis]|uniref:Uncharacterized protein n=1 Tax=Goodea atripinnis TaxID=208336 RepID=A0ABV0MH87_9TELE